MILQKSIPHNPLESVKLPGIKPLDLADWLPVDDAFSGQMAQRDALLSERRDQVLMMDQSAKEAAQELLQLVLAHRYEAAQEQVTRPDGVVISIDWQDPLATLGLIAQEDFCILQRPEGSPEHVLTGAVLCFPASWTLSEKFMRPLIGIHDRIDSYDEGIAARVQRLFDGVQVGRPLWRFNALWYQSPELFAPRSINDPRDHSHGQNAPYMRSEQQVILRLPQTRAVVFSIHTYMVHMEDVMRQWGR
ncbi:heme-dependent oxidative N-demethylase family protein [Pseudophaeobacter sp.]|uniref:heme-dependent oxidative N-demethylase family protein n=1 Tax=Pseudophaeobacter sp. TaxID=1971739 RepID=UPI0040589225